MAKRFLFRQPCCLIPKLQVKAKYKNQKITVFIPLGVEIGYGDSAKIIGTLNSKVINDKKNFRVYAKIEAINRNKNEFLAI